MSAPRQLSDLPAESIDLLNIAQSRRGILARGKLEAHPGRALTVEDLGLVATSSVGSKPPALKRIRAQHHAAARLLANGMRPGEVSALTGFSPSRISILQADPAFAELVAHYTEVAESRFADVQERMVVLGLSASEELIERITEDPEQVSTKELTELLKAALDRGGHAPVAKSENKSLSVVLGPDDLAALKDASPGSTILNKAAIYGKDSTQGPRDSRSSLGETGTGGAVGQQSPSDETDPGEGTGV